MHRKHLTSTWHSMIQEDRLLGRIDILENKLMYFQKNITEDKLRNEMIKLLDDKSLYQVSVVGLFFARHFSILYSSHKTQNSAKEALRKVYQERTDAIAKLCAIERALCSSEDECSLLRDQLLNTQQNLQDVTALLTATEEKHFELAQHSQLQAQNDQQHDTDMRSLAEHVNMLSNDLRLTKAQLAEMTKKRDDLMESIDLYRRIEYEGSDDGAVYVEDPSHLQMYVNSNFVASSDPSGKLQIIAKSLSTLEQIQMYLGRMAGKLILNASYVVINTAIRVCLLLSDTCL